ncbi:MAG TPA: chemotaxis protein CheX [Vicinamibacteria bacterium]|nr:chemotaxis protein CheX [Vicinamibacteria bacterium]
MRYDYLRPFVSSAQEILEEMLASDVVLGMLRLSPAPVPTLGVTAIVGVTGEAEGRVLFDMRRDTAIAIAAEMNDAPQKVLDRLAKDALSELASMMTGRAISVLNDRGHRLRVSPPSLIEGDNVEISNRELETLVVPLGTSHGEVLVNVAMATV